MTGELDDNGDAPAATTASAGAESTAAGAESRAAGESGPVDPGEEAGDSEGSGGGQAAAPEAETSRPGAGQAVQEPAAGESAPAEEDADAGIGADQSAGADGLGMPGEAGPVAAGTEAPSEPIADQGAGIQEEPVAQTSPREAAEVEPTEQVAADSAHDGTAELTGPAGAAGEAGEAEPADSTGTPDTGGPGRETEDTRSAENARHVGEGGEGVPAEAEPAEDAAARGQQDTLDRTDSTDAAVENAKAIELETNAGSAYYGPNDSDMREAAQEVKPEEGYYTVDMHGAQGDPDHVYFENGTGNMETLSADQLAAVIQSNENWDGEPVRLFSCYTGQDSPGGGDSFGQQLADSLGVEVKAPTSWVDNDSNGNAVVGSGGTWRIFPSRS
jgi:hypothetical protein